jgi:hypothetical protein
MNDLMEIEAFAAENPAAEAKVAAAEAKVAAAEAKVAAAEGKVAAAKEEVAAAEAKVTAAEEKVAAAEEKVAAAEGGVNGDKYAKMMLDSAMEGLANANSYAKGAIDGLNGAIDGLNGAIEGLNGARKYLNATLEAAASFLGASARPPLHPHSQRRGNAFHQYSTDRNRSNKGTPNASPSQYGGETVMELKEMGKFQSFVVEHGMASVLSESQQKLLDAMESEKEVVAYLTHVFEDIVVRHNLCVVNSENFKWIQTSERTNAYNQKPDLFFCHESIYSKRGRKNVGEPSHWVLRDCINVTLEAKMKIDNSSFGQILNYGSHICHPQSNDRRDSPPVAVKLILFDKNEFWLIDMERGVATQVVTCKWTDEGSTSLFTKFFLPPQLPWIKLMISACQHFDIVVEEDSFLGHGTFGRVFIVHRATDTSKNWPLALKLMLTSGSNTRLNQLKTEHRELVRIKGICPNHVMGVEGDLFIYSDLGGCLLLSNVGAKITSDLYNQVITSLAYLHQNKIVHGDARIDNAVSVGGNILWIDLRNEGLNGSSAYKDDMFNLVWSLVQGRTIPDSIEEKLDCYDTTPESVTAIIDAYRHFFYQSIGMTA